MTPMVAILNMIQDGMKTSKTALQSFEVLLMRYIQITKTYFISNNLIHRYEIAT